MTTWKQHGVKVLLVVALGFGAVSGVVFAAPNADAHAAMQPYYVPCSIVNGPNTRYGSTQNLTNGDTARPQIAVWYDSHTSNLVCREQAGVLWTTNYCSSRSIDVYFTNGVGGDKYTTMSCHSVTYYSNVTYSDACTFYMSARTSDSYQINWSYGPWC